MTHLTHVDSFVKLLIQRLARSELDQLREHNNDMIENRVDFNLVHTKAVISAYQSKYMSRWKMVNAPGNLEYPAENEKC